MLRKLFSVFMIACFCMQAPVAAAQTSQAQIAREAKHALKYGHRYRHRFYACGPHLPCVQALSELS